MRLLDGYILCTISRSGSTFLCAYLASTGQAGDPKSYFHRASVSAWGAALNLAPTTLAFRFFDGPAWLDLSRPAG